MDSRHRTNRLRLSFTVRLLCVASFVLVAAPRFRVMVGPVPVYILDVLLWLAFLRSFGGRVPQVNANRIVKLLEGLFVFVLVAQLYNIVSTGSVLEPVYMLVRYIGVFSLCTSIAKNITSEHEYYALIRSIVLGLVVTSVISVLVALPFTRGVVTTYVLSNPMVEPATEGTLRKLGRREEQAARGISLIGTSTLTGAFVSILWPVSLMLAANTTLIGSRKRLGIAGAILAPFGAIMTYSRGAIAGFLGAALGIAVFGKGKSKGQAVIFVILVVAIILAVGVKSEYFFFERIENRMGAVVEGIQEGEFRDERELGRLQSYLQPFAYLLNNPESIVLGAGNTRGHVASTGGEFAHHSTFGATHYYFGFASTVIYFSMFGLAILITFQGGKLSDRFGVNDRILFAATIAMMPWFVLGHAPISIPRGVALVMLIYGLIIANQRIARQMRYENFTARK